MVLKKSSPLNPANQLTIVVDMRSRSIKNFQGISPKSNYQAPPPSGRDLMVDAVQLVNLSLGYRNFASRGKGEGIVVSEINWADKWT